MAVKEKGILFLWSWWLGEGVRFVWLQGSSGKVFRKTSNVFRKCQQVNSGKDFPRRLWNFYLWRYFQVNLMMNLCQDVLLDAPLVQRNTIQYLNTKLYLLLWPLVIPVSCIVSQVHKSFQTPSLFRYLLNITASMVGEWEIQITADLLMPFVVCNFLCDGITSILKEALYKLLGGFYFSSEFWLKCIFEDIWGKPWRHSGRWVNSRT